MYEDLIEQITDLEEKFYLRPLELYEKASDLVYSKIRYFDRTDVVDLARRLWTKKRTGGFYWMAGDRQGRLQNGIMTSYSKSRNLADAASVIANDINVDGVPRPHLAAWALYGRVGLFWYNVLVAQVRMVDIYRCMQPDDWGMLDIDKSVWDAMGASMLQYGPELAGGRYSQATLQHVALRQGVDVEEVRRRGVEAFWYELVIVPFMEAVAEAQARGLVPEYLDMSGEGEWYGRVNGRCKDLSEYQENRHKIFHPDVILQSFGFVEPVLTEEWTASAWGCPDALDLIGLHLALGYGPWSDELLSEAWPSPTARPLKGGYVRKDPVLLDPL